MSRRSWWLVERCACGESMSTRPTSSREHGQTSLPYQNFQRNLDFFVQYLLIVWSEAVHYILMWKRGKQTFRIKEIKIVFWIWKRKYLELNKSWPKSIMFLTFEAHREKNKEFSLTFKQLYLNDMRRRSFYYEVYENIYTINQTNLPSICGFRANIKFCPLVVTFVIYEGKCT